MGIKTIEAWRAAREEKKRLRRPFIQENPHFRGELFQTHYSGFVNAWKKILKKFDPETGLGNPIYDNTNWYTFNSKTIESDQILMCTGKTIVKPIFPKPNCQKLIVIGLEVISIHGVGFLDRSILRGPLENKDGTVKLTWEPTFPKAPSQNEFTDKEE